MNLFSNRETGIKAKMGIMDKILDFYYEIQSSKVRGILSLLTSLYWLWRLPVAPFQGQLHIGFSMGSRFSVRERKAWKFPIYFIVL